MRIGAGAVMSMLMLIQAWRRTTDIWDSPILIHPFLYLLLDFSYLAFANAQWHSDIYVHCIHFDFDDLMRNMVPTCIYVSHCDL